MTAPIHGPCAMCGYDKNAKVRASWSFEIPRPVKSLNKRLVNVRGWQGAKYRQARLAWEADIRAMRVDRHIPTATSLRRLTLTRIYSGHGKAFDRDNLAGGMKYIVDAMVNQGLLANDTPAFAELHHLQVRADWSGLLVLLEELEAPCARR